jgi:hypothetical protein
MIDTAMRVSAWPETISVPSGGAGLVSVVVTNVSEVIDAYQVEVLGIDPEWVDAGDQRLSLFPGESKQLDLTIRLPEGYPASERALTVTVRSENDLARFELATVALTVPPVARVAIGLDPPIIYGGRSAAFGMIVTNDGNAPAPVTGFAVDPEELARFEIMPPDVVVEAGHSEVVRVEAVGGRSWFGSPRARSFAVGVDTDERVEATATFIQRPRIPRWMLSLMGLLAAATVFAFVLKITVDRVVNEASVADEVLDEALRSGQGGGAVVPADPGSVTGQLTTTTNRELAAAAAGAAGFRTPDGSTRALGVAAVQVELYLEDDTESPIATAATDDEGRFTLANLGEDKYKLLLTGAGYPEVWYVEGEPGASSASDATVIDVELGDESDLGEIQIGGIPVTIEGTVGGDAAGATLRLVREGVLDPEVPALLAEVEIGPDGSFTLPDIPSPADLEMIVEKPGSATVRRKVTLQPGDTLGDIAIQLTPAEGRVEGTVAGPDGPLGGVTIAATDGTHTIETVSYTHGDVGAFTLRNLSSPGRYTVTADAEGFAPQTQTVTLAEGDTVRNLPAIRLVPATGTIDGSVRLEGEASGDITILLTGGAGVERTARPMSGDGGLAGTFLFRGLPTPGTYTLTFSGGGAVTQVRVVSLDASLDGSSQRVAPVDLRRANRTVRGRVVELGSNAGVAGATVVLSDGVEMRTLLSADDPRSGGGPSGDFAFGSVPPGSYTLTASREGSLSTVIPITVEPGFDLAGVTLRLPQQASLSGTVITGGGACDLVVRLFRFELFDQEFEREIEFGGGAYEFLAVPAPVGYLVAVYTQQSDDPLATTSVASTPSVDVPIPPIDVSSSCSAGVP